MACFQCKKNTVKRTGNVGREIDEQVFVVNLQRSSLRGEHYCGVPAYSIFWSISVFDINS